MALKLICEEFYQTVHDHLSQEDLDLLFNIARVSNPFIYVCVCVCVCTCVKGGRGQTQGEWEAGGSGVVVTSCCCLTLRTCNLCTKLSWKGLRSVSSPSQETQISQSTF